MEAVVDVFKERMDKMDTTDLETNPEEIRKSLRKRPQCKLMEHCRTDLAVNSSKTQSKENFRYHKLLPSNG
jgi:hypothetical protein